MNDAITAFAFPATARTERFCKAHTLNFATYLLIAAVVALTSAIAAIDWLTTQLDKAPEYIVIAKLAKVRNHRRIVRIAIKAEQFRLAYAPRVTAAMDRVFCLS